MSSRKWIVSLFSSLYSLHFQKEGNNPYEFTFSILSWLILASSYAPYIAMSSIDDYKVIVTETFMTLYDYMLK